jgi:transposase
MDAASEIASLRAALKERDSRIKELEVLVDYLRRKPFKPSTEQLAAMVPLFDEAEKDGAAVAPGPVNSRRTKVTSHEREIPTRKALPVDLPREVVRHELPASERQCLCCGGALHEIGIDVTEQVDIIPQKIQVLRHERVKYGCRGCDTGVTTATMPPQPIPKSMASPRTLAHVAVAKYADHLPLYRQEAIWARLGVSLDRGTLASWMVRIGELLQPLVNLLLEDIKDAGVIGCDETTVQVLREKGKKPTSPGYMWVLSRAGPGRKVTVFDYDPSRAGRVARRLLADFSGIVVTDGYDAYKRLPVPGLRRAGCWAHVRRKFVEAVDIEGKAYVDSVSQRAVRLIGELYDVERRAADLSVEGRLALRQHESIPTMAAVERLLDDEIGRVPPKSPTGRALSYMRNEWSALQIYLRDGRVPIDNNFVENAIRPFALGRKNWLFSASPAGARASANIYSLIETAKANGIDPYAHLVRALTEIPRATTADEIAALLPYPPLH